MRWTQQEYDAYQARRLVSNAKQPERQTPLESNNAREAQSPRCVPVRFTLYRRILLDVDAKYSSVKDLLDCLVNAGFLAGDKEGQVDLKVEQVKVKTKAEERTEVEVVLNETGCPVIKL